MNNPPDPSRVPSNQYGANSRSATSNRSEPQSKGTTRPFQPVPYAEEEEKRIQLNLNRVLGPEYVSFRPGGGGTTVSYIEGWKALNLANEIFGFNGWNSEIVGERVDFLESGGPGRFSMGFTAQIRVTLKDGTYHEDYGYGYIENAKSKAMAFEKCKKEAITDGIKRCLRCFGNVLGNCLYDRTIIKQIKNVQLPKGEYEDSDFHRDPGLVAREKRKLIQKTVNILDTTPAQFVQPGAFSSNPNPSSVSKTPDANRNQINSVKQNHGMNEILRNTSSNQLTSTPMNNSTTNTNDASNKTTAATPAPNMNAPSRDPDDLDDSFLFSDDFNDEDSMPRRYDDYKNANVLNIVDDGTNDEPMTSEAIANAAPATPVVPSATEEPIPAHALSVFVSARGADLVQAKVSDLSKLPQFDPNFASPNLRRTVDQTKSAPVRRPESLAPRAGSQNSTNPLNRPSSTRVNPLNPVTNITDNSANRLGKRIGMPPQRPLSKRLHRE